MEEDLLYIECSFQADHQIVAEGFPAFIRQIQFVRPCKEALPILLFQYLLHGFA